MLHITDGESVAGTLRESAIPGIVSTYGDLMYEGPAPAGLDAETWRETRARFIASRFATLEEGRHYIKACEDTLAAFSQHEEVVVWLDHRLSDQLILIKVLDWFSRRDLGGVKPGGAALLSVLNPELAPAPEMDIPPNSDAIVKPTPARRNYAWALLMMRVRSAVENERRD